MWKKNSRGTRYESPSAVGKNFSPFQQRKFSQVHGPFPVMLCGRHAGFEKRQWFNRDVAERRTFRAHYGYNPRCSHKGTWGKPGHRYWMHDWWTEAIAKQREKE